MKGSKIEEEKERRKRKNKKDFERKFFKRRSQINRIS